MQVAPAHKAVTFASGAPDAKRPAIPPELNSVPRLVSLTSSSRAVIRSRCVPRPTPSALVS